MMSALGITRVIHEAVIQKSIGVSKTYHNLVTQLHDHQEIVSLMAAELGERLNQSNVMGRTLILEIKSNRFEATQRSWTFAQHVFRTKEI